MDQLKIFDEQQYALTSKRNLDIFSLRSIQSFAPVDTALDATTGVVPLAEETLAARGSKRRDYAFIFAERPGLIWERITEFVDGTAEFMALG